MSSNILRLKKSTSLLIHNDWAWNLGRAKNRQNGGKEVFGRGSCQSQDNLEQSALKEIGRNREVSNACLSMRHWARRGCRRYRANSGVPRDSV